MKLDGPLLGGRLLRRYQRFLADVELDDGRRVTAHTANTGAMLGCSEPGSRVWLRDTGNAKRKYPLSWELVETSAGILVGIHTAYANRLVAEAISSGLLPSLRGYARLSFEPRIPFASGRFDVLLSGHARQADCYVEVKNVTAIDADTAIFPDAVSARAAGHLRLLAEAVERGLRAVLCFCVQRNDVTAVRAASEIDPVYADLLWEVASQGVEVLALQAEPTLTAIEPRRLLPVRLRP